MGFAEAALGSSARWGSSHPRRCTQSIVDFIRAIPKVELHVHIEGTLEPELMLRLAERNGVSLPFTDADEVRRAYDFRDLNSFLNLYYQGARVLIDEEDFHDLTWAYLGRVAQQNVRHVEVFFDPQTHTDRGVDFETAVGGIHEALAEGLSTFGISSELIMCFLRDRDAEAAMRTLETALSFQDWIIGVGLDSAELNHPPRKFERVFDRARSEGFRAVAHAGEEGPPEYIWQALDVLKVERIDHGVRCVGDPTLVERLARDRMPLTVCPLSNVKLRVFPALENHNLKQLLDLGLVATVNSDDPAYFGGYITENFLESRKAMDLTQSDIYTLACNSIEGSFLDASGKHQLRNELNDLVTRQFT